MPQARERTASYAYRIFVLDDGRSDAFHRAQQSPSRISETTATCIGLVRLRAGLRLLKGCPVRPVSLQKMIASKTSLRTEVV
jgi:hypothetical protein